MKKVIVLLILLISMTGCSNDDNSSKIVKGQWSTDSFEVTIYAGQNYSVNEKTGVATIGGDPQSKYNESSFGYNKKSSIIKADFGQYPVFSNENKVITTLYDDSGNIGGGSFRQMFDFSVDKQITRLWYGQNNLLYGKHVYFYR